MKNDSCDVSSCYLCSYCIPEWKELIAVKKRTLRFKKGERLFTEGEKVTGIFFIYAGAVKVHKQWIDQKELIISFTKAGDMIGHRGLAAGELYPVSATTLEDSKACFISSSFLETTLKTDHAFTYRLMQFYAAELQKAEMRMRNLALMEVNGRIAETLLELFTVFGTDKNKYISVPVTRQDIAAYAGTTYETVFKFLKTLTVAKTISVSGKSIRINNADKLKGFIKKSSIT
ncbi:MAG: Crp/Fnr family transcriptional regulator [Bacteroidota bacterium]